MRRKPSLRAFARDENGAVIFIFAFLASVLLTLAGGAVDMAKAYSARTHMQLAADTAALAAANDPYQLELTSRLTAYTFFDASKNALIKNVKPKFVVNRSITGSVVSVTVLADANIDTGLLQIIGMKKIPIAVAATATRPMNSIDIYAVIDMSASMGIAADGPNRQKLLELTKPLSSDGRGCAFACHFPDGGLAMPNSYDFARSNDIRLREDVMKEAFSSFVDVLLNPAEPLVAAGQRRIGTYGFSDRLEKLLDPSNVKATVTESLNAFPTSKRWSTRFKDVLPQLATDVGVSGTGAVGSPRKTVVLVTDGVGWDRYDSSVNGAMDPALCTELKRNGVNVVVLEIKYFEDVADTVWFVPYVGPFYPNITPNLQACASSGMYFRVDDTPEQQLRDGFAAVARSLQQKLALTR